ncbi:methyltransferase domain-containing protein [Streptomyces sp. M19]
MAPDARILDYGCGYGRLAAELTALGYREVHGWIPRPHWSPGAAPTTRTAAGAGAGLPLPHPDGAFDAALLFAVLTCVPAPRAQEETVAELARLLRPGGCCT